MGFEGFVDISPYSWESIGAVLFCGGIVGVERQLRGKPVGVRTAMLITLGTYVFTLTARAAMTEISDPSRILGQVITGVGFLGAGVMLSRDGAVVGVTSAASIWVLAAIGTGIAFDHLSAAIKLSILAVAILSGVDLLETHTRAFSRGVHARIKRR
jgi:putative Mg2+ transporter-C (MgtC) family protein